MRRFHQGLAIAAMSMLTACVQNPEKPTVASSGSPETFLGYQPRDPIPAKSVTYYDPAQQREVTVPWGSLVFNNDLNTTAAKGKSPHLITVNDLLPLQSARVTVKKLDSNAGATYLASSVSQERGNYEVIMDFMKYRVDPVYKGPEDYRGDAIVGVGMRIRASVVSRKADINFSSLAGLGLAAKEGNITGSIAVDVFGIDSPDVTNLIPLSTELDQTSIQQALQGLAAIKAKLWQNTTHLYPHVLGIKQAKPNQLINIERQVAVFSFTPASERLRLFWKPDGKHIDKDNEQRLKAWMKENNVTGLITMFLYDASKQALQQKAAEELLDR